MYSRNEVVKMVHDSVIETFDLEEVANSDLSFKDDLDANSLDMVSLALVLEEEFSAEIEEDKIEDFKTINDVIDYIIIRQQNKAA